MYLKTVAVSASVMLAALAMAPAAEATTYSFDRVVGTNGHAFGFFETDGTIGAISTGNITNYSVTIQDNDINGGVASTATGNLFLDFNTLFATATDLLFDFDNGGLIYTYTTSGDFWCLAGNGGAGCFDDHAEVIGYSDSTGFSAEHTGYFGLISFASTGASAVPVPAALPLLATALGALGFAGWRRSRKAA